MFISKIKRLSNHITDIITYSVSKFYPKFEKKLMHRLFLKNGLKPIPTKLNFSFIVHPHDKFSSESLFTRKYLYSDIYGILKTFSIICNSFIDVGANIGYFTVSIGKKISKKGLVIAIEPEPINFLILKKNIKINKVNAIIEQVALSNEETMAELLINKDNKGGHSLFEHDPSYYEGKIMTKTTTLNNLIEKYNLTEPILVKIDVEGYEYNLFKAGNKLLEKKSIIVTEFSPPFMKILGQSPKELLELVTKFGYKIYDIQHEKLILPQDYEMLCKVSQTNLIFINL